MDEFTRELAILFSDPVVIGLFAVQYGLLGVGLAWDALSPQLRSQRRGE